MRSSIQTCAIQALLTGACLCAGLTPAAQAAEEIVAEMKLAGDAIAWNPVVEFERLVLTVGGGEAHYRQVFAPADKVIYELVDQRGKRLPDGTYRYELKTEWDTGERGLERQRELREKNDPEALEAYRRRYAERPSRTQSGVFTLRDGKTVEVGSSEPFVNKNRLAAEGSVIVSGDLEVTGKKAFVAADPERPGQTIHFVALEGPEAGTYYRTTSRLVEGEAVIELSEAFALVTEPEGLTVQLTPVGGWSRLYVASRSPERLVVRSAEGGADIEFDVLVQGVRRGFADHQPLSRRPVEPRP